MKKLKNLGGKHFFTSIVILILVMGMLFASAALIDKNLMERTHQYGQTLVKNYASEEEVNIKNFRKQIELAGFSLIEFKAKGANEGDFKEWFKRTNYKMTYMAGDRIHNFYGVVDGKAYSALDSDKVSAKEFKNQEWYKKAIEAGGKTVFTGIYKDEITGNEVTTVARKMPGNNDVIAMDLTADRSIFENNVSNFVNTATFYIFDKNDNMYFYETGWNKDGERAKEYSKIVIDRINNYNDDASDRILKSEDGTKYGMYFTKMESGGTTVMIVPIKDITEGQKNIILSICFCVALIVFVVVAGLLYMDIKQHKNIDTAEETIGLLGDMYYAIYRVNSIEKTYECIKTTEELEEVLGKKGSYDHLAKTLEGVSLDNYNDYIEKFNNEEFTKGKKAKDTYTYYGGEFQRKFGDEYKWVNLRIIQNGKLANGESIWCFRLVDAEKKKELEHTKMLTDNLVNEEKKAKEKSEFFSKMSHDMRTPLNAIIGFSNLSKAYKKDPDHLMEYMEKIGVSAKQVLTLINDILEYSNASENVNKLNADVFDLRKVIGEVKEAFVENAEKAGKRITTDLNIHHDVVIGDCFKLVQVLNNLVSNSLKYSELGDRIVIKVRDFELGKHEKYQIVVEDTGIGMSEEFLQHIYEPYSREVQVLSKTETMGTGLGMLIVKNLVDVMNGDIYVQSELGVGTTVTITLPFDIAEEDQIKGIEKQEQENVQLSEEEMQKEFFKGKKILVAEDNELNMEIVMELLKMRGAIPTKAWNGQEAVEQFKASEEGYFDFILMDMHMPIMDGCDAARAIRDLGREDSSNIPIIAVTANAFAEDIDKTTAAGMNGHVPKPLDFNVLYKLMKKEGL